MKIPPATEAEVKQAIRKLNNGKAADENGIQAEHFKFANAELVTEICSITNQIFEEFNIPDILKRGILTPVLKKNQRLSRACIVHLVINQRLSRACIVHLVIKKTQLVLCKIYVLQW